MEVRPVDKEEVAREKGIYRVTIVGSVVNFLLLLFKFFAGIAGHSAAMLADAVHSLSDFVTDIIVIVFVRISSKPEDYRYCIAFCRLWNFLERRFIYLSVSSRRFFAGAGNAGIDSGVGVHRL